MENNNHHLFDKQSFRQRTFPYNCIGVLLQSFEVGTTDFFLKDNKIEAGTLNDWNSK